MSVCEGCNTLRTHKVGQNNSGVRIDPDAEFEVYVREKWIVDLCLQCENKECSYKVRDDRKAARA